MKLTFAVAETAEVDDGDEVVYLVPAELLVKVDDAVAVDETDADVGSRLTLLMAPPSLRGGGTFAGESFAGVRSFM